MFSSVHVDPEIILPLYFTTFCDCICHEAFDKWKCRVACLKITILNSMCVCLCVCLFMCVCVCVDEHDAENSEREKEKRNVYVSHTNVTYGTERYISVCRCTVKRGMLSCFPFMICQQKRRQHQQQKFIYQARCTEGKQASNNYKNDDFYSNRRVEKRDTRTSNQFRWHWVGWNA